jgi:hypothetical protein
MNTEKHNTWVKDNHDKVIGYKRDYKKIHPEKEREYQKRNREIGRIICDDFKQNIGCQVCGYNLYSPVLEFHHVNRSEKKFSVGIFTGKWKNMPQSFTDEINKCVILCSNCHIEQHLKEIKK